MIVYSVRTFVDLCFERLLPLVGKVHALLQKVIARPDHNAPHRPERKQILVFTVVSVGFSISRFVD